MFIVIAVTGNCQHKEVAVGFGATIRSTKFSNPNAKIIGTTNILVKDYRDKRFGLILVLAMIRYIKASGYDWDWI